jgi:hypothetical protein
VNPTISPEAIQKYGEELVFAYLYALEKKITTITDIDKVNLYGKLTRAQAAKMLSTFAINPLNKKPDTSKQCDYPDIQGYGDLTQRMITSCQLGIMGVNVKYFNPNGEMTRAEFGTVLSRILRGNTYNKEGINYYEAHLQQLQTI